MGARRTGGASDPHRQALKQNIPIREQIIWNKFKGQKHGFVEVVPFKVPPAEESFCLVLFEQAKLLPRVDKQPRARGGKRAGRARLRAEATQINQLRRELESTRESLQAIIEEREATTEEVQSANEELQSTNEELQTSKEELQSANEELRTVNDELEHSNLESSRVNNDLTNLLASVQIPVVMVDHHLAVRRFTPSAQKFFNLIPTDIGRSINDINTNLDLTDLDRLILKVIQAARLIEQEVRDRRGHWYSLRIHPYGTRENKVDGAVLALIDIDELKRGVEKMMETVWEPFLALDGHLRVVKANEAFYEKFHVPPQQTEGVFIYEMGNGQWDIPALRCLLEEVLPQKTTIKDFAVEHDFPTIGHRKMLLNARRSRRRNGQGSHPAGNRTAESAKPSEQG
jgi:two-component system CheB/CheR fusion protein